MTWPALSSYTVAVSTIDELLEHNRTYGTTHGHRELATAPSRRLAVLTCMDSRLDLFGALGLALGEVHLIRNAGGLASEDVIRSLFLSQRALGTRSVMVIHHTRCGLEGLDESELLRDVEPARRPAVALGAFRDLDQSVHDTVALLRASAALERSEIRGFVFDVDDGSLREVVQSV